VTAPAIELDDLQGLVAAGYGHLPSARFVLLRVEPGADGRAPEARAWLARVAEHVTTAQRRQDRHSTNVALTHRGLIALGLDPGTAGSFSAEFVDGLTAPHRSRWLGDTGESAPAHWRWGGPGNPVVDIALLLYAADEPALEELYRSYVSDLLASRLVEVARLGTAGLSATEPFGFADGIAQPVVDGLGATGPAADTVQPGEFILGYRNEYGLTPVSPTVSDADDPGGILAPAESGARRDLGRNGTYLVFRELRQDVDGFRAFLDESTRRPDGRSDPLAANLLAAKMVGRWPSGTPLVLAPDADDPALARANDFGYFHDDRYGLRCPIGAHIRRANPRDSLDPDPGSAASIAIGKRHRIIRRGRERGPDGAAGAAEPADPGLHFMCLNANLARQFEFIQGTWCNNPKFAGLHEGRDPLVTTQPDQTFRVPGRPVRTRYTGIPSFVQVVGGAYFFLPGVRALRFLARPA
jgi:Dyp-type peroxidase family